MKFPRQGKHLGVWSSQFIINNCQPRVKSVFLLKFSYILIQSHTRIATEILNTVKQIVCETYLVLE